METDAATIVTHDPSPHPQTAPLEIRLFGVFEARLHGEPLPRLRTRKGEWLLALLALRAGRETERSWLAGLLWPDSPEPQALQNLRVSLADLRRALGPEAHRLRSQARGAAADNAHTPGRPSRGAPLALRLDLSEAIVDVVAFDAAIARHDRAALEEAVALYRGPLLEECVEEWAFQERQLREQAYLDARERLADLALAGGDPSLAAGHLRRALLLDPLRETLWRSLMRALVAAGDVTAALVAYRELRLRLQRELNTGPDPETDALYEAIRTDLRSQRSAGNVDQTARRPADHRTRRQAPGAERRSEATQSNLRVPLTSFVGREREMSAVKRLLFAHRLLTLTGAGGCGKSRLALETAADLLGEYTDGVWLVELASPLEGAFVSQAVASVLGAREQPGRPLVETLIEHLKPRQLLLLLDNCEPLAPACARLAEILLGNCPHLWLLATSRVPLGLTGETLYPVPALSLPEPEAVSATAARSDAVRLFVERAAAGMPGLTLSETNAAAVTRICRRLDGLPLALELAAARARAMSLQTLAERLEDGLGLVSGGSHATLPHHQTLRASIDWSYALLSDPERALLRRLSVFAGGWTLEAVEAVCGEEKGVPGAACRVPGGNAAGSPASSERGTRHAARGTDELLDLLVSLVDKSLVVYEAGAGDREDRYRLLETVRQYAAERLIEAGEEAIVRGRHLAFHVDLAETAESHLVVGTVGSRWLDRLERELDNLRSALTWAVDAEAEEAGLRLVGALGPFWDCRGYYREGQERSAAVLALPGAVARAAARARALETAAMMALRQPDFAAAGRLIEESLAIGRELGDPEQIAFSLSVLGNIKAEQGEFAEAQLLYEESISLRRSLPNRRWLANSLINLGWLLRMRGEYDAARALQEESLAIHREIGTGRGTALALCHLGTLARCTGDFDAARRCDEESLAISRELNDHWGVANALCDRGNLAVREGDYPAACSFQRESLKIRRDLGLQRCVAECLEGLAWAAAEYGLSITMQLSYLARAARLFGAAETLRRVGGIYAAPPGERAEYEDALTAARATLGEAAFAAAWAEGGQMTMEQACTYALQDDEAPPRDTG
jgi:predicted ATPase/DNA-binding SARP family transcriptional activator/Tfp pilus assembly protein PilF